MIIDRTTRQHLRTITELSKGVGIKKAKVTKNGTIKWVNNLGSMMQPSITEKWTKLSISISNETENN